MLSLSEIHLRDPFVLLVQDTYYLYGTRGATCWGPATGFDVYESRDLISWSDPQPCFENDGTFWADRNYWAPKVHVRDGKYYLFASFTLPPLVGRPGHPGRMGMSGRHLLCGRRGQALYGALP